MTTNILPQTTIVTIVRRGDRYFYGRTGGGKPDIEQTIGRDRARQIVENNPRGRPADGDTVNFGPLPCDWHWSVAL